MAVSREARFVPGVWGPYFSAMVPGLWLTEGGQSATGSLIDHVIVRSRALRGAAPGSARAAARRVYELLNERLDQLAAAAGAPFPAALTRDLHVLPYFHGNRSPRADPTLRGMVAGLKLSDSIDDLALLYLATVQAIAYGTRHIVEAMNAVATANGGARIADLLACGGGTKNPVFVREHADASRLPRRPAARARGGAAGLGGARRGGVRRSGDGGRRDGRDERRRRR